MIDQGIETDLMIEEEIDQAPDQGIDITEEIGQILEIGQAQETETNITETETTETEITETEITEVETTDKTTDQTIGPEPLIDPEITLKIPIIKEVFGKGKITAIVQVVAATTINITTNSKANKVDLMVNMVEQVEAILLALTQCMP